VELELLTVNLWGLPWPVARDRVRRTKRLNAHLAERAYDLVGIQELWWPWHRRLDLASVQLPATRRDSGLALAGGLASPHGVQVAHFRHHRGPDRLKRKGVLWAVAGTREGARLRIGVTHLQAGRRHAHVRARQVEEIVARVEAERAPVVLMGDFNLYADSEVDQRSARSLHEAGLVDAARALAQEEPTFGSGERFDRIYLRGGPEASLEPVEAEVLKESRVSDHHPVRVRVGLTVG